MEIIENIEKELGIMLSEKRYLHSIGTMKIARILAKKYNVDEEKAALVGLVHDIAKELPPQQITMYIKKYKIEVDEIEQQAPGLLHAKIGAHLAREKYQFTKDMQNAILYHTTAHSNMDKLAKILYVADKTEENRNYDDVQKVRELALQDLDAAVLYILNYQIQKHRNQNKEIHPNSILAREALLKK